nr:sugar transport protein 8-like [Ipomoea batatas]
MSEAVKDELAVGRVGERPELAARKSTLEFALRSGRETARTGRASRMSSVATRRSPVADIPLRLLFAWSLLRGGVTSMNEYLEKFFPAVYVKKHKIQEDNIVNMMTRSFSFVHLQPLLVVPLFISEIAPANRRSDDLSTFSFNVLITIGSLLANIVNFLSSKYVPSNGWRVSFGIAAVPAIFAVVAIFGANYFGRRSLLIACIPGCGRGNSSRKQQIPYQSLQE